MILYASVAAKWFLKGKKYETERSSLRPHLTVPANPQRIEESCRERLSFTYGESI
jgi:hypothetical protein